MAGDDVVLQIPDPDPCTDGVLWSSISAASAEATLAGLLAGLLIAAVAALIVQWYQGAAPPTIALFGSGVPALMLSTYLFVVIAGVDFPKKTTDWKSTLCNQLWSQWILAIGLLFVGSAILVCGLGWALISYADNLAVDFCKTNVPITTVEDRRNFLIRLNAWLSGAIITAAITLLLVTNVTYLKAIDQKYANKEIFGVNWYVLFFVFLFGLYCISRSSYVVLIRTRNAGRANKASCAAYAAGGPPAATDDEGIKVVAASEFVRVMCVVLSALLAAYLTSEAVKDKQPGTVSPKIVIYVVVLYVIVRAIYILIAVTVELVSAKKDDTPTDNDAVPPANAKSAERIRINYSRGRLRMTTYSVVVLAVLGTFFVAALALGPLVPAARITISLFLGGFYPATVLTWLSSSVPGAAEDVRKPKWETLRRLAFIP